MGTHPPSAFHQIWKELGAIAGRKVLVRDEMLRVEDVEGATISLPANLDQLALELKRIAPEDLKLIDQVVRDARRCALLEPPLKPLELMSPCEKMRAGLRYVAMAPIVFRLKNLPITAYLARCKSPILRKMLQILAGNEDMSALVLVTFLGFRTRKNTGFVAGGSWDFAMAIANRYTRLGGTLRFGARVTSVKVHHNRAVGVECSDGAVIPASIVVSCADGYTTIFKMLEGRFVDKKIRDLYETGKTFPALLQVSLGIGTIFPDAPHALNLPLLQPLRVDGQTSHDRLEVEMFSSDSGLCPEGATVMTVRLQASCEFWTSLNANNPARYQAEKNSVLQQVIAILDTRFPGLARHVDYSDVATPATFVRHTGNWRGSYEGWLPTPRSLGRRIPCTLPGLKNFFMGGHWVLVGGGLPLAALSGRYVAQMICAQNGKSFAASEA